MPIGRSGAEAEALVRDVAPPVPSPEERAARFAELFASEAAFRAFYDRALPRLYGYLVTRCHGDAATAEDLAQIAFLEAVRRRHTYDGRADPQTWLIGIARHKLVDHFREQARSDRRHLHLVVREIATAPDDRAWASLDERTALVEALGRLEPMHQAALVLHYADGLPVRDVARHLRRSESATESLLVRARAALRAAYGEERDG